MPMPKRMSELEAFLPDAAVEEVGRELVIYTGLMRGEDFGDDCELVPHVEEED